MRCIRLVCVWYAHGGPRDHGLCSAADAYRDAALGLERHVHRLGHVDHYVKRLVSRLENAACDFKAASHDLGNVARLNYQWDELQSLHSRVEQALLTGCAANDPGLHQCWMSVAQSFQCLQMQMSYLRSGVPAGPYLHGNRSGCRHMVTIILRTYLWFSAELESRDRTACDGPTSYPAPAGTVVLPAAPFGSTLGTMPFPHSAAVCLTVRPHTTVCNHPSETRRVANWEPRLRSVCCKTC